MAPSDEAPPRARVAVALRVAGVPLRLEILHSIARAAGPVSPSAWVQQRGQGGTGLREAAYHFRYLRDAGLIVLEEVRTNRGTAEHLYVPTAIGSALAAALPELERAAAR